MAFDQQLADALREIARLEKENEKLRAALALFTCLMPFAKRRPRKKAIIR